VAISAALSNEATLPARLSPLESHHCAIVSNFSKIVQSAAELSRFNYLELYLSNDAKIQTSVTQT